MILKFLKRFLSFFLRKKISSLNENWIDSVLYRTAIHEAGHTIVAYYCTAVNEVQEVKINNDNGGHTLFVYKSQNSDLRTVILLAGIAAELLIYKKFRSYHASEDLLNALELSENCNWELNTPEYKLPFHYIFKSSLNDKQILLLNNAYSIAKKIILFHQEKFYRLAAHLLNKKILNKEEIELILGSRLPVKITSLFQKGFLPNIKNE